MILALIQVRMGSTRLPKKAMLEIGGKPSFWHIYNRLLHSKLIDKIVVATSENPDCDGIEEFCRGEKIPVYRGSEDDLLDRLYQASKSSGADTVLRITGDCPLIDPKVVDDLIRFYKNGSYDFASNNQVPSFPHGLDCEIFSFRILEKAWKTVKDPELRAFATFCLYHKNPENRVGNLKNKEDLSHIRITLDYEEDLKLIREIFERIGKDVFYLDDILGLFREHPDLVHINDNRKSHHRLKDLEGYIKRGDDLMYYYEEGEIGFSGIEREEFVKCMCRWFNDDSVTYYMVYGIRPGVIENLDEDYSRLIKGENVVFLMKEKATGKTIGIVGLYNIFWQARYAEFRILIGEREFLGKGIGTMAAKYMVRYAFEKLNLNKVWLGVNKDNERAVGCYRKAGFIEEGILRDEVYRNNRYYDIVRMGVTRKDYEKA